MIAGPYQTVILGERLVDILRVEMLCQLGSKMLRECLLCLPCLSTRDLSFPTAVLQSHYQGCHVTSFGFSQPTFILWSRSLFWWSSGRDEVTSLRCCRLCQSDPSFGSVSFTPVPLLSLCALQGGGIGGEEEGRGHFHPGCSSRQLSAGRATSSMPSNGPLFHTSTLLVPPNTFAMLTTRDYWD